MSQTFHILNGDALNEQFPDDIHGTRLIARECLVDGDVSGTTLEELFASRALFLETNYPSNGHDYRHVEEQFLSMQNIPSGSEINLWFEDDLFCQVNFWFVVWLLSPAKHEKIYLVRPESHSPYGFSRYDQEGLKGLLKNKLELKHLDEIANLWIAYQENDIPRLTEVAGKLSEYPFIQNAVKAHLERYPNEGPGRPERSLLQIMKDLDTKEFGPVFQEFNKRESIYGFGDLQVKRIYDQLLT